MLAYLAPALGGGRNQPMTRDTPSGFQCSSIDAVHQPHVLHVILNHRWNRLRFAITCRSWPWHVREEVAFGTIVKRTTEEASLSDCK